MATAEIHTSGPGWSKTEYIPPLAFTQPRTLAEKIDALEPEIIECKECKGTGETFWNEIADWAECERCRGEGCIEVL